MLGDRALPPSQVPLRDLVSSDAEWSNLERYSAATGRELENFTLRDRRDHDRRDHRPESRSPEGYGPGDFSRDQQALRAGRKPMMDRYRGRNLSERMARMDEYRARRLATPLASGVALSDGRGHDSKQDQHDTSDASALRSPVGARLTL